MQQQYMPFGWPLPLYLPLPPTIEDNDLFINSVVGGTPIPGPPGADGTDGVSVISAEVSPNPGNLLITLSDGTVLDAGQVIGPPGPSGGTTRNVVTITCDYTANETDYYIGADLLNAATVTLPYDVTPGTEYVLKLEIGSPIGTRKLTIKPQAPALINGLSSLTLNTPYQSVSVIYNNNNWWTI
jgi:hypothetical protein